MSMRTIFCIIQGRYKPTEEYYISLEAAISTAELVKCNATNHMELNKTDTGGGGYEDCNKRFQEICFITPADFEQYSGI